MFDVAGKTIVPGFIDTHAHWFEIRRGILDTQNSAFLANLAYGVTAGLDVQTSTNDMFAYQDLVDSGDIIGLRAFSTGPGVFSDNDFKSMEEVKGVLTKYRKYYGTHNIKSYIVGNRKQRQFMVQASKELEMMPTTEGGLDLKLNLTHVIDGFHGNEHTLPITPLYKDVLQIFAQSGIAETPTLIVNYGGPVRPGILVREHATCTTTRSSTISRRTTCSMKRPTGGRTGSAKMSTRFRNLPRRWRSSRGRADLSEWAATGSCRGSAITGRCGCWRAAE